MRFLPTILTTHLFFLLVLGIGLPMATHASYQIESEPFLQVGLGVEYFEDKAGSYSIDNLRSADITWGKFDQNVFNVGYSPSDWWIRFELTNADPEHNFFYMEVDYPVLDYLDVYFESNGQIESSHSLGDKLPFKQRPVQHRLFLVPINIEFGETQTVYVRVKSSSSIQAPIKIWEPEQHKEQDTLTNLIHGVYIGGMLIIGIYNLLIFIALRDNIYIIYVSYVFSMLLFLSSLNGWTFQYLWPESTQWNDLAILVFLNGVVLFTVDFARRFLALEKLGRSFQIQTRIWITVGISGYLFYAIIPYDIAIKFLIPCASLACLWTLSAGLYAWHRGQRSAGIYVISWTGILVGGVLLALNKIHLIPRNIFTDQAVQLGSMVEVMLLSFALAQRINYERARRFAAQQTALDIQTKAKAELEANVAERTKELEIANNRLKELSDTDQLTELKNRRYLDQFLSKELMRSLRYLRPLTVILIDIDHFKQINDNHGHLIGDDCLKEVAARFAAQIRFPTDLCARYGGEEFCVVLPETDLKGALVVAERIRHAVNDKPVVSNGFSQNISVSLGVFSKIPDQADTISNYLENADHALYSAKENGRNQVQPYLERL